MDCGVQGQGDAWSQIAAGNKYYHGRDVKRDYAEAVKQYRKAAESNDQEAKKYAAIYLGYTYAEGGYGLEKDFKESARWYRAAAESGDDNAYLFLGHLYEEGGPGLPLDYAEALFWLSFPNYPADTITHREGAARHLTTEQTAAVEKRVREWKESHQVPFRPYGVPSKSVLDETRRRAENGESMKQWNLGNSYFYGNGLEQNYVEAYFWLSLAQKDGFKLNNFPPPIEWHLTPEQIAAVQKRLDEWLKDHPAPDAGRSAAHSPQGK